MQNVLCFLKNVVGKVCLLSIIMLALQCAVANPVIPPYIAGGGGQIVVIEILDDCMRVYPNPSTDGTIQVYAVVENDLVESLELRTLAGVSLLSSTCHTPSCSLDASTLEPDTYLLVSTMTSCQCVSKVIVYPQ